jgi:hypothetical protein
MSGRKIADHSSWIGKGKDGVVYPSGAKMKMESSADGFGALGHYEDTTDTIRSQQEMAKKKVHGHPHKAGTRN